MNASVSQCEWIMKEVSEAECKQQGHTKDESECRVIYEKKIDIMSDKRK